MLRQTRAIERRILIDDRSGAGTSRIVVRLSIADRIIDIIDGEERGEGGLAKVGWWLISS